jgi:putative spermidine/putrescine transport system permease protein
VVALSTQVAGTIGLAEDLAIVEQTAPGRRFFGGKRNGKFRAWRFVVLVLAGVYFLVPLWAGFRFSLAYNGTGFSAKAYSDLANQAGFGAAIWLSVQLAVVTTIVTLVMMVPTTIYIHLRLPKLKRAMDFVTALPIVIPPVVLILGVLDVAPARLKATPFLLALEYVVLAVPFSYRALDAGVRSLDLRILVDASRSLGGDWWATMRRVLLPNMRVAILSATVLTVALVLGEYTMASLDQYQTFPTWIVLFESENSHVSVAASLMALFLTWVVLIAISMVGRTRRVPAGSE